MCWWRTPQANSKTGDYFRLVIKPHRIAGLACLVGGLVTGLVGDAIADMTQPLETRLDPRVLEDVFPGATRYDPVEGDPPIVPVIRDGAVVGYVFSTFETVSPGGYSGEPFDIIVGMDADGRITGAELLEQREPMIGPDLIPEERLENYFESLRNVRISSPIRKNARGVDGVSGATISATLMYSAILLSGRKVARIKGLSGSDSPSGLSLDVDRFEEADWAALLDNGSMGRLSLSNRDVEEAFSAWRDPGARPPDFGLDEERFIDLYAALATPAGIGRNIFGNKWYNHHIALLGQGDHLLMLASTGRFPGLRARPGSGGRFYRLRLSQNGREISLDESNVLQRTAIRIDGAPPFNEYVLVRLPKSAGLDPLWPWSLDLTITEADAAKPGASATGAPSAGISRVFSLGYRVPTKYVTGDEDALVAAGLAEPKMLLFGMVRESRLEGWQLIWAQNVGDILILAVLLIVLTLILLFQDALTRYRRLHMVVRVGFLAVVLGWLGWAKDAQLTSLNVLTYAQAAVGALDWQLFLIDPLIFILSVYVGLSLILWGRGVFCGWLCPFGALQELLNKLALVFRVPQITVPDVIQEKLWALKYVIFVVIAAIAVRSMDAAGTAAEIEPFKTAIVVGFDRSWPYVLYAGILLTLGLTIERFFCRYLCPLGGALAILGRVRLLTWLKRRPQCGNPCSICKMSCPVGAIKTDGVIDMNECFQCLDCQVDYYDNSVCPPLVARRKRLERLDPRSFAFAPGTA
jgi:transcriptional regulator of nitric oxide reductase/ferredoxin